MTIEYFGQFWTGGRHRERPVCCRDMRNATLGGSDNEGYGSLIKCYGDHKLHTGCGLQPLNFCPWCGQKIDWPWLKEQA